LIAKTLLVPFWAAQLLTGAKSFADNPLIGNAKLNAHGLHIARVRLAHTLAARRRQKLARRIPQEDRDAFNRDGFILRRNFLPAPLFQTLLDEVSHYRGHAREMIQGDTITRRIAVSPARLPSMAQVMALPAFKALIRFAWSFDAEPIVYVQTILSHAIAGPADPQGALHADTFHPTVKAWLFLTDVTPDDGPFTYVPGSHRATPARLAWEKAMSLRAASSPDKMTRRGSFRIAAEDLPGLGLPPPLALPVPANTLIVADTHGFHARGPSTRPSRRVEIWAYGRRNPFFPWTGLDAWSIGNLAERRVPLYWASGDIKEKLGLGRNVWRPREQTSAFDEARDVLF
jgi:hypothetical protein